MSTTDSGLDFKALFEALPGAFLVLDRDYTIIACSDQYVQSLRSARERLVGRPLFELMATNVSDAARASFAELRASFDRVAAGGEAETLAPQPYEAPIPRSEGGGLRRGFMSVINTPLRDADGQVRCIIHRVHDVSESQAALRRRDQAEALQRTMADRHALALAASGMGAWDYDRTRGELTWDDQAKAMLGYAGDAPLSFADFFARIHPDDQARVRRRVDDILSPEGPDELSITYRILDADGAVGGWLEARGRATYEDGVCLRVNGVLIDVTARQRYESHLRLLINELNHRVKNTLAVVQSIAAQTLRPGAPTGEARERFIERLMALAAAHDILTRENWEGADLATVVERALAVHASGDEQRVRIDGLSLRVSPRVALSLAMALHELATNAAKYGALSASVGQVGVCWTLDGDAALRLIWTETGGPRTTAPKRKGFGMRLLERVLAQDIGGAVQVEFAETGLVCTVCAPAEAWRAPRRLSRRPMRFDGGGEATDT